MQVDVLPVGKRKYGDNRSCTYEYPVNVFHFSVYAGNANCGKKMLDPFLKFPFVLLVKLAIKLYIVIEYFLIIIRQMNNFSCSSYSEYKQYNDNDQYKYKKYLQNSNH